MLSDQYARDLGSREYSPLPRKMADYRVGWDTAEYRMSLERVGRRARKCSRNDMDSPKGPKSRLAGAPWLNRV